MQMTDWLEAYKRLLKHHTENCDGDCEGEPGACVSPCPFYIAPDVDGNNMPTPGVCELESHLLLIQEAPWIPGRPDKPGDCLVSGCGYVGLVHYDGEKYDWMGQPIPKCPMTHWMPKPSPAKSEFPSATVDVGFADEVAAAMATPQPPSGLAQAAVDTYTAFEKSMADVQAISDVAGEALAETHRRIAEDQKRRMLGYGG